MVCSPVVCSMPSCFTSIFCNMQWGNISFACPNCEHSSISLLPLSALSLSLSQHLQVPCKLATSGSSDLTWNYNPELCLGISPSLVAECTCLPLLASPDPVCLGIASCDQVGIGAQPQGGGVLFICLIPGEFLWNCWLLNSPSALLVAKG